MLASSVTSAEAEVGAEQRAAHDVAEDQRLANDAGEEREARRPRRC